MNKRGKFRNRDYANQQVLFEGLQYGNITPTDIDAILEFGNKLYVTIEVKHGDSNLTTGQKILLERMTDKFNSSDTKAIAIHCSHDTSGDIDLKSCEVRNFYWKGEWTKCKNFTVKDLIDQLHKKYVN